MNFEKKFFELSKVMEDLLTNRIKPAQATDRTYYISENLKDNLKRAKEENKKKIELSGYKQQQQTKYIQKLERQNKQLNEELENLKDEYEDKRNIILARKRDRYHARKKIINNRRRKNWKNNKNSVKNKNKFYVHINKDKINAHRRALYHKKKEDKKW